MDEHKHTVIIWISILVILLFAAYKNYQTFGNLQEQIAQERADAMQTANDNQQLLESLIQMRLRVVELNENLTDHEAALAACIAQLPPNSSRALNNTPRNRVPLSSLLVQPNKVIINIQNATPGIIAPTGSMLPLLDKNDLVLEMTPASPQDIFIGDIIIYELGSDRIIHRVVSIGRDDEGWFAVAKGDNNPAPDPLKVRFSQVKGVVVGIIY